jgi:8-oxo-dGTP pyrophosphatase MutT (NUDIX family)
MVPAGIDAQWLRERFRHPRPYVPVSTGDRVTVAVGDAPQAARLSDDALIPGGLEQDEFELRPRRLRAAAVLIPFVERPEGLQILLTRRTAHLHDHAGQISFPGGREEPEDGSPEVTALRETEEEIGLARANVEILGRLNRYITVTGYQVTPVAGLVRTPFQLAPDEFEVAEIFEVPVAAVLNPDNHQRNTVVTRGARRRYYAIPHGRYYIWGATAAMLLNLYSFLCAGNGSTEPA